MSALHIACLHGNKSTIIALLQGGAEPLQKTPLGEDAYTIARRYDLQSKSALSINAILRAIVLQ